MKNLKLAALAILIFAASSAFSQDIIDANGDVIATIDDAGKVYDLSNYQIGQFSSNGEIRDGHGDLIGSYENGEFKDITGNSMGTIDDQGKVYDINNAQIGSVQAGLMVVDANDHVIGRASASTNQMYLAGYFFFFFGATI